ncbi:MAG: dihydrolipoyllysine-residue succinyltransferase, partial [Actinobacteria bacterium]|nr:dihydrolipoyllysine-residue succinyltransferase [Actinomycetota bacterium]
VSSPCNGFISEINKPEGDIVSAGELLVVVDDSSSDETISETEITTNDQLTPQIDQVLQKKNPQEISVTPVAKKMAEKQQIDLKKIEGSGPSGKILKTDVEDYRNNLSSGQESSTLRNKDVNDSSDNKPEERIRLSRRRITIAKRLKEVQSETVMTTTFNEVDLAAVIDIRKKYQDQFIEKHGVKIGFMSFFVKASVNALQNFPNMNSELFEDELIVKKYYDIGIAVSTEEGLVVPVLREADKKTTAEIEKEIAELATKSRNKKITLEELQGGTFSITNGGVFGSLMSTPILNPPQVAILGMHRIQEKPLAIDGEVVIRPVMMLAITYDHRIIDGAMAVQFLVRIKNLLEDPHQLLIDA